MPLDDDLYRMKRGRSLKDIKPPTLEAEFEKWQKKQFSHYPEKIHNLGTDSEGIPIYLTQEDRNDTHIHILGRPGQGKSKLLAKLITDDLRFGYGAYFGFSLSWISRAKYPVFTPSRKRRMGNNTLPVTADFLLGLLYSPIP